MLQYDMAILIFGIACFHFLLDPLKGWNQIIQLPNCVVYQKLYKDTGLFQYKVIGSYEDITARDFIDVQVQYANMWMLNKLPATLHHT